MKGIIILTLLGFSIMNHATADETLLETSAEEQKSSSTQKWLELQRSGTSASTQPQPISGEVMDRAHQRYLKSFEKSIPEFYEHESPVTR